MRRQGCRPVGARLRAGQTNGPNVGRRPTSCRWWIGRGDWSASATRPMRGDSVCRDLTCADSASLGAGGGGRRWRPRGGGPAVGGRLW